ncbi:hypothetical protein MYP_479 [Sporocytophaga myxococcoides]|uniref:Uncharacterized protein n=2 Tax=Sporocytophaga myxococcoides TaxID=153721 RepID=A0A098LAS9_9BACT|nr:hypothetical protein MYP_479 [Sporocytophaga myxococcoides]
MDEEESEDDNENEEQRKGKGKMCLALKTFVLEFLIFNIQFTYSNSIHLLGQSRKMISPPPEVA